MKATPATKRDRGYINQVPSLSKRLYQKPRTTKLSVDQAKAIVADLTLATDSEIASASDLPLKRAVGRPATVVRPALIDKVANAR